MTDLVKLFFKLKYRGLKNNKNCGMSSFFKGAQLGPHFAFWKKSNWFLPPHNTKRSEKIWFFSKPEKNVLHDHFGKGVKHETKKSEVSKKTQQTKNLHLADH